MNKLALYKQIKPDLIKKLNTNHKTRIPMKSTFSLALLASVSLAGSLPGNDSEREFLGFAGKYNKHYKTTE